jgi:hypothetical protein
MVDEESETVIFERNDSDSKKKGFQDQGVMRKIEIGIIILSLLERVKSN